VEVLEEMETQREEKSKFKQVTLNHMYPLVAWVVILSAIIIMQKNKKYIFLYLLLVALVNSYASGGNAGRGAVDIIMGDKHIHAKKTTKKIIFQNQ